MYERPVPIGEHDSILLQTIDFLESITGEDVIIDYDDKGIPTIIYQSPAPESIKNKKPLQFIELPAKLEYPEDNLDLNALLRGDELKMNSDLDDLETLLVQNYFAPDVSER